MPEAAVSTRIERLAHLPTVGFDVLLAESELAGLRFLRRLADDWASGANRFDQPGEALFGARIRGEIVAVGGLNVDPYARAPGVGRVRHVYVLSPWRRSGIGGRLVTEIVAAARNRFDRLHLRTGNLEAARLYERRGFVPCADVPHCSHVLELTASQPGSTRC